MRKRVRCVPEDGGFTRETSGPPPVHWLNLGSLPKDMRKLVYSLLTPDDKYVVKCAYSLDQPFVYLASNDGHRRMVRRFHVPDRFYERCAENGYWNLVRRFIEKHARTDETLSAHVFSAAVKTGQLPLIQWLLCRAKHNIPMADVGMSAVMHGQLHVLQWAATVWCPLDASICYNAIRMGNLDMLEWLFCVMKCKWNRDFIDAAIWDENHLHVLDWINEKNYLANVDWRSLFTAAYSAGKPRVMKWYADHGAIEYICDCIIWGDMQILQWANENHVDYRAHIRPTNDDAWEWIE